MERNTVISLCSPSASSPPLSDIVPSIYTSHVSTLLFSHFYIIYINSSCWLHELVVLSIMLSWYMRFLLSNTFILLASLSPLNKLSFQVQSLFRVYIWLQCTVKYSAACLCVCVLSPVWLCDPTDCSQLGSSVHGLLPGKTTRVACHFLLQGIFLTQRSNPGLLCLLHWQADSLSLSHQSSPTYYY